MVLNVGTTGGITMSYGIVTFIFNEQYGQFII